MDTAFEKEQDANVPNLKGTNVNSSQSNSDAHIQSTSNYQINHVVKEATAKENTNETTTTQTTNEIVNDRTAKENRNDTTKIDTRKKMVTETTIKNSSEVSNTNATESHLESPKLLKEQPFPSSFCSPNQRRPKELSKYVDQFGYAKKSFSCLPTGQTKDWIPFKQFSLAEQQKLIKQLPPRERQKLITCLSPAEQQKLIKQLSPAEQQKVILPVIQTKVCYLGKHCTVDHAFAQVSKCCKPDCFNMIHTTLWSQCAKHIGSEVYCNSCISKQSDDVCETSSKMANSKDMPAKESETMDKQHVEEMKKEEESDNEEEDIEDIEFNQMKNSEDEDESIKEEVLSDSDKNDNTSSTNLKHKSDAKVGHDKKTGDTKATGSDQPIANENDPTDSMLETKLGMEDVGGPVEDVGGEKSSTENKESDGPYEKFHRFLRKELPKRYPYITVDHVMDYFKDKNDCEEYDETNRDHREGFRDHCKFDEVIKYVELYLNYFFLNFKIEKWFDLTTLSEKVDRFSSSSLQKQTENKKSDEPYEKFHRFLRKELATRYPHICVKYVMDFFKDKDYCKKYNENNYNDQKSFRDHCKFNEVIKYVEQYRNYFFRDFKKEEWMELAILFDVLDESSSSSSDDSTNIVTSCQQGTKPARKRARPIAVDDSNKESKKVKENESYEEFCNFLENDFRDNDTDWACDKFSDWAFIRAFFYKPEQFYNFNEEEFARHLIYLYSTYSELNLELREHLRHKMPGRPTQHLKDFLQETQHRVFNVVKLYRQYFLLKLTYQEWINAEELKNRILTHLFGGIHTPDFSLDIWLIVAEFSI